MCDVDGEVLNAKRAVLAQKVSGGYSSGYKMIRGILYSFSWCHGIRARNLLSSGEINDKDDNVSW